MKTLISLVAVGVSVLPSLANAQDAKKESKNLTQRVAHEIVEFDYAGLPPEVIAKTETLIRASLALSRKVKVHLDEKMEALFAKGKLPARVVVTLKDGKTLEREVLDMKGEPENPIPEEEHSAKVKALIDSSPFDNVREYARTFIR